MSVAAGFCPGEGRSAEPLARLTSLSIRELNHTVDDYTDPKIYNQTEIQAVGTMPACGWQMRHQRKEIQKISSNHRNRLFQQLSPHAGYTMHAAGCKLWG